MYEEGKLPGVHSIAAQHPEFCTDETYEFDHCRKKVILLFMSSCSNPPATKNRGLKLAKSTDYRSFDGYLHLKGLKRDNETVPLNRRTSVYRIPVPKLTPESDYLNCNKNPSEESNFNWLIEEREDIVKKYPYNEGRWEVYVGIEEIDEIWGLAKKLYNSNELHDVHSIRVSTYTSGRKTGRLHFICGPCDDRRTLLRCAGNFMQKLDLKAQKIFYDAEVEISGKAYSHVFFNRSHNQF